MTEVFQFALLGVGAGAIYALLGQGLVLIYRGSGILNLAHGAFAMAGAYLFYELHLNSEGPLMGTWPAILITIAACAALGVVTDQVLMRRLRGESALARLIGTLALLIIVQAIGILRYGPDSTLIAPLFEAKPTEVLGATVGSDRLYLLAIACALTLVLWLVWRFSRIGWVMSAVSENQRSAAALGWSPERISALTWGLGAGLAGLAGLLIAPITALNVNILVLTITPALAAALIGGFTSFPLTLLGGVLLGSAQTLTTRYLNEDVPGANEAVPFLIIVLVLALRGSTLPLRGYITDKLPEVGVGQVSLPAAAGLAVLGALLIGFGFDDEWVSASIIALSVATILLSVVVLTGYSGQLSLAQYALAGMGALIAARLVEGPGLPFLVALLLGVFGATAVGLLFALPALRTRGVELAVVTLGLGSAATALFFNNTEVTTSTSGTPVGNPSLFGFDIGAFDHPHRYALFCLALFLVAVYFVSNLRRGRSGRRLLAVRTNERAAAAMGISVTGAKLHAFAVAGGLAGLGGVLLGFRATNVIYTEFSPLASITAIGNAVIGGIGYVVGPIVGSLFAPDSIGQQLSGSEGADAGKYLPLTGGIVLVVLLLLAPNGLTHLAGRIAKRLRPKQAETVLDDVLEDVEQTRVDPQRLAVRELGVRYGGVVAVDGVTFEVGPGQVLGLIGPNGAGKTSIIDALTGFTKASGTIELDGKGVSGWSAHRRARSGLVRSFQSLELFEDMTVLENLQTASDPRDSAAMATDLVAPGKAELPPVAAAAIREFELSGLLDKRPPDLSYGQRRLVAIARSVAMNPGVLLLDEPAAGLDSAESQELARLVRKLADDWGIAVLLIEHDMAFVMGICDRIVVIDFGRQIAEGTPDEIQRDDAAIAAYLGEEVTAA